MLHRYCNHPGNLPMNLLHIIWWSDLTEIHCTYNYAFSVSVPKPKWQGDHAAVSVRRGVSISPVGYQAACGYISGILHNLIGECFVCSEWIIRGYSGIFLFLFCLEERISFHFILLYRFNASYYFSSSMIFLYVYSLTVSRHISFSS